MSEKDFEFDWTWFEEFYKNGTGGKFKVGQTVKYIGSFSEYRGKTFKVLAVNVQDEESTEYLLEGFPWLVYEELLEELTE